MKEHGKYVEIYTEDGSNRGFSGIVATYIAKKLTSSTPSFVVMSMNQVFLHESQEPVEKFVLVVNHLRIFYEDCLNLRESETSYANRREYLNEIAASQGVSASFVISKIEILSHKLDHVSSLFETFKSMHLSERKFNKLTFEQQVASFEANFLIKSQIYNSLAEILAEFWSYLPHSFKRKIEVTAYKFSDKKVFREKAASDLISAWSNFSTLEFESLINAIKLNEASIDNFTSLVLELTGGEVPLRSAEESFREGWHDIIAGRVSPIDTLWDGIDAK
ncbi:hypothetical protein [Coleofasciculus sp. FACHB-T130]|uniref:hypothetical protein n=1 Tax=Cyanophyceae TaxID=3028117 RepID=UPI00168554E1|nr:hypothetical protein [Coleofasciculus sp. FACHB-T130]MBD1878376.1 hypothetical protein [Coleofasciculus sp. FACHB-T130]